MRNRAINAWLRLAILPLQTRGRDGRRFWIATGHKPRTAGHLPRETLMKLLSSILVVLLASATSTSDAVLAQGKKARRESAGAYRVLQKIPVPGDGGYDYLFLDEPARRLCV